MARKCLSEPDRAGKPSISYKFNLLFTSIRFQNSWMIGTLDGIISSMCQKGPHTTEWSISKAGLLISNGTIAMLPLSHSYLTCACLHLSGSQVSLKSTDSYYRQQRQRFSGPLQRRKRSHWFCYMRDPALHEGIQWYWELFETFWLLEI